MRQLLSILALIASLFGNTSLTHAQWVMTEGVGTGGSVSCIVATGTMIFAGTAESASGGGGVYVSTNYGASWSLTGLKNAGTITSLAIQSDSVGGAYLFAGDAVSFGYGGSVYRSTNNGTSWVPVLSFSTDTSITCFAVGASDLFVGTSSAGVYRTTDHGSTWTQVSSGLTNLGVGTLAASGTTLFAGTGWFMGGLFRSTDSGLTWHLTALQEDNVIKLCVRGSDIFVNTEGGDQDGGLIHLSTDNGTSWSRVYEGVIVHAFAVRGRNLFMAADPKGVLLATGNGTSWTAVNSGLSDVITPYVHSMSASDAYLFASINNVVWRRPLAEMVTSVWKSSADLPSRFSLGQNYPNPFNPTTRIRFNLPLTSRVSLKVFDLLGREVSALVNEELRPGSYEVTWDGTGFPGGVYFYRLSTREFSETKRLILLR